MKTPRRLTLTILTLLSLILTISSLTLAYSSQLKLEEGATLTYRYAIISTGSPAQKTGNATFQILTFNQTTLFFRINATESLDIKINYQNGFPTYIDSLFALIYLPPECIAQTLQENLEWTKQVKTQTLAKIANMTSQTLNFTVEAGTFQSINITLNLVGWEYGNLTLIYDLNSGILVYEQWIPEYGDMIIQSLSAVTQVTTPQNVAVSILLTATTFTPPIAITIRETNKALKKRRLKNKQPSQDNAERRVFPKKPLYLILTGATLNLASTLLPWSQLAKTQMHLPLSLPTALTASKTLIPLAISLTAHASAITAWIGIAISLYTKKKLTPQLAILVSSILSFASAVIFVHSSWTPFWGVPIITIGGILTILGLTAINIKNRNGTRKTEYLHTLNHHTLITTRKIEKYSRMF